MPTSPTWDAEKYQKSSPVQQKWAKELISRLALKGNEAILDIGCGDGKVTAELAVHVPRGLVVGLDNSLEMIRFAREHFPTTSHQNLSFELGEAENLKFDCNFDLVVSFACLHWVTDHRPVLAGIRRALKPGGKALLQFGGKGNAAQAVEVVERVISRPEWQGHFRSLVFPWAFYDSTEYRGWLNEAGLNATRVDMVAKDMAYSDRQGLKAWFQTTWMPYIERVPQERREQLTEDVLDAYTASYPPDSSGIIHINMMRLEIEIQKD
jgi:trans-aconitate 2-methyltransferase